MIQAFGLSIIGCIAGFVFTVYLVSYAINTMKLPAGVALSCAMVSGVIVVTLTPFFGALSDRIGRRPLILACAMLNLLFDYPLFLPAIQGRSHASLLLALAVNAVFQSMYTGTIPSILAEMFPTRVRYTALSVSYGSAVMLFGGFAPLISTWLVKVTGNPFCAGILRDGRRCTECHRHSQHEGIPERAAGLIGQRCLPPNSRLTYPAT